MTTYEIVARICITLMTVGAAAIAIPAAFSALKKWRTVERERAAALAEREERLRLGTEADEERQELREHGASAEEVAAVGGRYQAALRERGYAVRSYNEASADDAVRDRVHAGAYQAPREVWWGLVALTLATGAAIWDLWL